MNAAVSGGGKVGRRRFGLGRLFLLPALAALVWVPFQVRFFAALDPGNAWGMGYGIAAAVLLVVAMAYGIRRRFQRVATRLRVGRTETWLHIHLGIGALFLVLVLVHSGLHLPQGVLTWWLFLLSLWVVASGVVGWALQQWIPKSLSGLETEVLYERIPSLCRDLQERAALLAATCQEPVRLLHERLFEPELRQPRRRFRYLIDKSGGRNLQWREVAYLAAVLDEAETERLEEIETIVRTKIELDVHYTLQPLLRWWLVLHLPAAVALTGLVVVHVLTVVYY